MDEIVPLGNSFSSDDATARYQVEAKRKAIRKDLTWKEYLESLSVQIDFRFSPDVNFERCAEMTRKTNQFNFTTIRRTRSELEHLCNIHNKKLLQVSVSDNFGDYGITGLVELSHSRNCVIVEQFLMSCRVLGRGVEEKILEFLVSNVLKPTDERLILKFRRSEKNAPAAKLIQELTRASSVVSNSADLVFEKRSKKWILQ